MCLRCCRVSGVGHWIFKAVGTLTACYCGVVQQAQVVVVIGKLAHVAIVGAGVCGISECTNLSCVDGAEVAPDLRSMTVHSSYC